MEFDTFTVVFLMTPAVAPQLDEESADAIHNAHLNHLATLHEAGHLLAAGPLADPERRLRGLSILKGGPEQTRALCEEDPAVQAGVFELELFQWSVPSAALGHTATHFPHSAAEAEG